MDNKQAREMINYYVNHHLLYAKINIKQADASEARKIGRGLVKSLGVLGKEEVIEQVIKLVKEADWTDVNSLKNFQENYTNIMQENK